MKTWQKVVVFVGVLLAGCFAMLGVYDAAIFMLVGAINFLLGFIETDV